MQRIGRVDRRMNPETEERLLADHPDQRPLRGKIAYWSFLPPDELETLLLLFRRVANKTLQISKTFGIEGRKLLRPEDEFEALREFNHQYEGSTTVVEDMRLELQRLLAADPELGERVENLPGRVFSGREHPTPGTEAVFFCYRLPRPDIAAAIPLPSGRVAGGYDNTPWTEAAGETRWYLYRMDNQAKYLGLGSHAFCSVASCLDRFLGFSAHSMMPQDRDKIDRMSSALKQLATTYGGYVQKIPSFWKEGRQISDDLTAHQNYLVQMRR